MKNILNTNRRNKNNKIVTVTDKQRQMAINLCQNTNMSYRDISNMLRIGYDNTRKIHRVYILKNRSSRLRRATPNI